jgi:NAD-dependent deacetylase
MRSEREGDSFFDIAGDIHLGDLAPDGFQLRPHVVWFGEAVPMIEEAAKVMKTADIFILVGTSLQVYPAAGLIDCLPDLIPKYIIDKNPPPVSAGHNFKVIKNQATLGIDEIVLLLIADSK